MSGGVTIDPILKQIIDPDGGLLVTDIILIELIKDLLKEQKRTNELLEELVDE